MGSSVKGVLQLFQDKVEGFTGLWESTDTETRASVISQLSHLLQQNTVKERKKRNRASTALQKLANVSTADDSAKKQLGTNSIFFL